jgi:hypothetical protein
MRALNAGSDQGMFSPSAQGIGGIVRQINSSNRIGIAPVPFPPGFHIARASDHSWVSCAGACRGWVVSLPARLTGVDTKLPSMKQCELSGKRYPLDQCTTERRAGRFGAVPHSATSHHSAHRVRPRAMTVRQ